MLKTTAPSIQPSFFDNICQDGLKRNVRLAKIDRLLSEIPDLLGPFIAAYEKDRKAQGIDENNGKPTISLETIIRLILLRHLHINCTFRDVEDRTTTDMSWKAFAKLRFTDTVPDFTTIAKWQAFFGEEAVKALHDALVAHLVGKKVIKGRRMRTDTTVVPANIHYPTDATLLADAVKVITRTVEALQAQDNHALQGEHG